MHESPKKAVKVKKSEQTRNRLLKCAMDLFSKNGFEETSVDSIVQAAGLSKGAFYVYFSSKDNLIAEYLGFLDLDYRGWFESLPADYDPPSALAEMTRMIVELLQTRCGADTLRAGYRAQIAGDVVVDPFVATRRDLFNIYRQILERGKAQGSFRADLDCERMSEHFVMSIRSMIFEWLTRYPIFRLQEESVFLCGLFLEAIKAR